jgi:hypothetical protein
LRLRVAPEARKAIGVNRKGFRQGLQREVATEGGIGPTPA